MDVLTERLAKPQPGTFKYQQHTRRLARVRSEWYKQLLKQ